MLLQSSCILASRVALPQGTGLPVGVETVDTAAIQTPNAPQGTGLPVGVETINKRCIVLLGLARKGLAYR